MSLSGKVALVTGAGSGIGKASAISLAKKGADLVLWGRTKSKLSQTGEEILSLGRRCLLYPVDVTLPADLSKAVQDIQKDFGEIDILVNSAGVNIPQSAEDVTVDAWNIIMDTNVKGLFFCCQSVGKQSMMPREKGVIINISSQAGKVALPYRAVYCASKGAVDQLTRVLAYEWAKYKIRVNAVAPTFVETPFTEKMLNDLEFREFVMSNIPLKRLATAEDVANAVCFLASDESNMITGAVIPVDGGWTIH
ncbi:MAG: SDR family NAD(P)-dependent oxidoreductase [Candidatus Bathyarchaeota archaeon]|jgi:2-deoxy-D-gluconate 3-dehydrogenase|nr:SDR family NAD(P)-dependent oxidoreductase [Candidatus Bathyarchaeota archaeon]